MTSVLIFLSILLGLFAPVLGLIVFFQIRKDKQLAAEWDKTPIE